MSKRLEKLKPTGHGRARGIVSSKQSGDRVRAWRYAPAQTLADVVECFWAGQWDLRDQAPHHNEMLSDPSMHFVIENGPSGPTSRWVGVWSKRWKRTMKDWGQVWGVKLKVGAVQAFLPEPAHHYCNEQHPLEPGDDWYCPRLIKQVVRSEDHGEGFGLIEAWLVEHRRPASEQMEVAMVAMRFLDQNPQIVSMDGWAEQLRVSPRTLQRLFRAHVGVTPKWVLRRKRLQEAALRIEVSRGEVTELSLTALAQDLGYTDHPHFCRDFKRAVGKTPSEFLRQDSDRSSK